MIVRILTVACAAALTQAPQPPPGMTRDQILDNATALIAHLRMEPGSRETIHTHPFSAVVVQLTAGDIASAVPGGFETHAGNGSVRFEVIPTFFA